jgi:hypothetical protein
MAPERVEHGLEAGPPNERHDHIDGVGRGNLRAQLMTDSRLSGRIREHGRIEERSERPLQRLSSSVGKASEDGNQDLAGIERKIACKVERSVRKSPETGDQFSGDAYRRRAPLSVGRGFDRTGDEAGEVS